MPLSPSLHILKSVWEPKLKSRPCILYPIKIHAYSGSLKQPQTLSFSTPKKCIWGLQMNVKSPSSKTGWKQWSRHVRCPIFLGSNTGFQLHFWVFPGLCFYVQNRMPSAAHVETSKVMDIDENDLMQLFSMIDPRLIAAELCVFFIIMCFLFVDGGSLTPLSFLSDYHRF